MAFPAFSDCPPLLLDQKSRVVRLVFLFRKGTRNEAALPVRFARPGPLRISNGFPARLVRIRLHQSSPGQRNRRIVRLAHLVVFVVDFLAHSQPFFRCFCCVFSSFVEVRSANFATFFSKIPRFFYHFCFKILQFIDVIFLFNKIGKTGFADAKKAIVRAMVEPFFEGVPQQTTFAENVLAVLHLLEFADLLDCEGPATHGVVVQAFQDSRVQVSQVVFS